MATAGAEPSGGTRCARCGAEFACGMQSAEMRGEPRCWCAELPPLDPAPGRGCLCRACLEEALKETWKA